MTPDRLAIRRRPVPLGEAIKMGGDKLGASAADALERLGQSFSLGWSRLRGGCPPRPAAGHLERVASRRGQTRQRM